MVKALGGKMAPKSTSCHGKPQEVSKNEDEFLRNDIKLRYGSKT